MFSNRPLVSPTRYRPFVIALTLYLAAILPILRADRFYVDDMGRALTGFLGWSGDGRPLANVLMEAFNLGTPLTDISPLPQLVSIVLLATLAAALATRFRIPGDMLPALVCAPLVLSPFFLENLSYKFDALTMTLAVFLAVMMVLKTRANVSGLIGGILGLTASLSLYQAAFSTFLVFVAVEWVYLQRHDAPVPVWAKTLSVRGAQAFGALALYQPVVALSIKGGYSARHSQIASLGDLSTTVARNTSLFWGYVYEALTGVWGRILLVWIAVGIVVALGLSVRYLVRHWAARPAWQRLSMIVGIAGIVPGLALAPWGPLLALRYPVLLPRTLIGFGALAAAASVIICFAWPADRRWHRWRAGLAAVPLAGLLIFAHVYGNTLKAQKDLEDTLARQISEDLGASATEQHYRRYAIVGSAPRPPVAQHSIKKYPLLSTLVPINLKGDWGWADDQLKLFGLTIPMARATERPGLIGTVCNTTEEPIMRRARYRIHAADGLAVILLGEAPCQAP